MRNIILKSSLFLSLLAFAACGKDDDQIQQNDNYSKGVFVVNEGVWGMTSGSISLYNPNTNRVIYEDLFQQINARQLGNVAQSISFDNDYAYIVVNAANKVEIVNKNTWVETAQITDLESPRMVQIFGDFIYISQWGADGFTGAVKVYNKNDFSLHTTISTYAGAEKMLIVGDKLWLTHIGGYGVENRIAIINTNDHSIETTITLDYDNINSIVADTDGNIWVACSGNTVYTNYPEFDENASTAPALVQLSNTGSILKTVALEVGGYANNMALDMQNNILYFLYKEGIYSYNIATENLALFAEGTYYGVGFDNTKNELYIARANGSNPSTIFRMIDINNIIDSFSTGAAYANGFNFQY